MKKRHPLVIALAAASLATALSACAPLIVGGAAVSALVAVDRRTSGTQVDDETIELKGSTRLRETFGDRAHINLTSYNRQALLTGEVPSEEAKRQAEQIVSHVDNIRGIVNELAVLPSSTLGQRSNDVLISGKVKASLIDEKDLYVGAFQVVTERSVVYLMGRVTPREADTATQIARTTGGVQRVVRVFDILSEEDLRRLTTSNLNPAPVTTVAPAPAAAAAPAPVALVPAPEPVAQPAPVTTEPAASVTTLPPAR